jgi:hypothetical protein
MADRADWEQATSQQRQLAVAADAELRRRHPDQRFASLRSAEPDPVTQGQRDELMMSVGEEGNEVGQWIKDLAAEHRTFADRLAERQSMTVPSADADYGDGGAGVPALERTRQGRDLAAAQAGDPPISAGTGTCYGPRPGCRGLELTAAGCMLGRRRGERVMTSTGIVAPGLSGVLRMTWAHDDLAHVLEHADVDEPSGTWTGLACRDHELALGGDVDNATLRRLAADGKIADLVWEAPEELAAEHGQAFQSAMQGYHAGDSKSAEQHWLELRAMWSRAWAANHAALELLQNAGTTTFSPIRPQRWVIASFEHHSSPHGLSRPACPQPRDHQFDNGRFQLDMCESGRTPATPRR